jgi:hypothetical protein
MYSGDLLFVGCWLLVVGGWWLVVSGWWLVGAKHLYEDI